MSSYTLLDSTILFGIMELNIFVCSLLHFMCILQLVGATSYIVNPDDNPRFIRFMHTEKLCE